MIRVWIAPLSSSACADCPDTAVHHVARRDDVDAGLAPATPLAASESRRFIVHHVAGRIEDTVLTVRRVGIERNIGQDAKFGKSLLQLACDARHDPVGIRRLTPVGRLERLFDDRKQRDDR